jgi:hypothetical protein
MPSRNDNQVPICQQEGKLEQVVLNNDQTCLKKLNAMASFDLVFNKVPYPVPREFVSPLLDHRPDLQNQRSYRVQSPVSQDWFEASLAAVRQGSEVLVGPGNVGDLILLSREFYLEDLRDQCTAFPGPGGKSGTDLRFGDVE